MKLSKVILVLITIFTVLFSYLSVSYCTRSNCHSLMRVPIDIEVINSALVQFEVRNGYLPVDLMEVEESGMISLSKDPWGSDYQYVPNARVNRRVFSMGADGEIGGEGLAADIYFDTDIKKLIAQY